MCRRCGLWPVSWRPAVPRRSGRKSTASLEAVTCLQPRDIATQIGRNESGQSYGPSPSCGGPGAVPPARWQGEIVRAYFVRGMCYLVLKKPILPAIEAAGLSVPAEVTGLELNG